MISIRSRVLVLFLVVTYVNPVPAVERSLIMGRLSLAMTALQIFWPAARISATTRSIPRLSMILMPLVLRFSLSQRFSLGR